MHAIGIGLLVVAMHAIGIGFLVAIGNNWAEISIYASEVRVLVPIPFCVHISIREDTRAI